MALNNKTSTVRFIFTLFCTLFFSSGGFFATHATPLPPSAELPRLSDVLNSLPVPKAVPVVLPEPPTNTKVQNFSEADRIRFVLKTLAVNGVSIYQPDDLIPLFENLTGQETSVAELYKIAAKITAKYRNDGYILARAFIPPQDVTSGNVSIKIVEGHINDILLIGDPKLQRSRQINAYVQKLKQEGPFNAQKMERYLLLLNDLPGVSAQSNLKPAAIVGASDLVIHLGHQDFEGDLSWNNWGSRFLGPRQVEATGTFNNLLPQLSNIDAFHDQLQIRGIHTTDLEELGFIDGTYRIPIGTEGLTLEGNLIRSISRPGLGLDDLDINSNSDGWSATLRYPLKRTRAATHNLFGTFLVNNTKVTSLGNTTSEDKLRVLRLGIDGTTADKLGGISTYRLEFSRGLPLGEASTAGDPLISRERGIGDNFYKSKLDVARLQRINDSINILLAGSAQFSTHALLAAEEFGVGGENFGRGYDNSEIIGDHGAAAKVELQYNFEVGGKLLDEWQLFFFQDIGAVWNKDLGFGEQNTPRTLSSNGFGIRAPVGNSFTFDFTFAVPRTRNVNSQGENNRNPSIFARVKKRFAYNRENE